jgi:hypothetical protein
MLNELIPLLAGATEYIWIYCNGELFLEVK